MTYAQLKRKFLNGMSLERIGVTHRVCPYRLGKRFKRDGLSIVRNNQKHEYHADFFDVIDTEEKAYWLGFLYADGYVDKRGQVLEVGLAIIDIAQLKKLVAALTKTGVPIKKRTYNGYKSCRALFGNKMLVAGLKKQGCTNAKSKTIEFPTLPPQLVRHFLRGYFDGDGSIGKTGASLCSGSLKFLHQVQSQFVINVPGYTTVSITKDQRNEVYSLQKGSPRAALKMLRYMYADTTLYLDRKYRSYTRLSKHKPSRRESAGIITAENIGNPEMGIRPEGESQGQRLEDAITPPRDRGTPRGEKIV